MYKKYKIGRKFQEYWKIVSTSNKLDKFARVWKFLSKHVTPEMLSENFDKNWDWAKLSSSIPIDFIIKHPDKNWNLEYMSLNPSLKWEDVLNNLDKNWRWDHLSRHPNITFEIIKNNPQFKWNKCVVPRNRNVTFETIKNNPDFGWRYDSYVIVGSVDFDLEYILQTPEKGWNWSAISRHVKHIETVVENPNWKWDWFQLSSNKNIKWEDIEKYPNFDWVWSALSFKKGLKWKFVSKNLDKSWDYSCISELKDVTLDIVKSHNVDWNWAVLSRRIHRDEIENNPDQKWIKTEFYLNPTMDMKNFTRIDCVELYYLSCNKSTTIYDAFKNHRLLAKNICSLGKEFSLQVKKEYLASLKIKEWWINLKN